ncbi:hypothetical protein HGRIS_012369 [Hohenbuehelia grisea]|uniref:Uncharacterized protein n=1 Tax=Hohenbuehelia grisea TaxID=104357 RepID=A0ABR3IS59_9AGAR
MHSNELSAGLGSSASIATRSEEPAIYLLFLHQNTGAATAATRLDSQDEEDFDLEILLQLKRLAFGSTKGTGDTKQLQDGLADAVPPTLPSLCCGREPRRYLAPSISVCLSHSCDWWSSVSRQPPHRDALSCAPSSSLQAFTHQGSAMQRLGYRMLCH